MTNYNEPFPVVRKVRKHCEQRSSNAIAVALHEMAIGCCQECALANISIRTNSMQ
ncbi:MAG: hypothetical protein ACRYF5_12510 [Janthinobacterium lividum]